MEYNPIKKQFQYTEEMIQTLQKFLPTSAEHQDLLDRLYADAPLEPPRTNEEFLSLPKNEGYQKNLPNMEKEKEEMKKSHVNVNGNDP
jgi:hypothetical protein